MCGVCVEDNNQKINLSLYYYIEQTVFNFQKYAKNVLKEEYLSDTEYIILMRIAYKKHVTQKELADKYNLSEGYVAKMLRDFEDNGFVQRIENSENRRQKIVSLTEKGIQYTHYLQQITKDWEEEITLKLTDDELKQFKRIFNKLI